MSLEKLVLRPGVVLDDTEYAAAGYAISTQWVRWWLGRPTPLGGYRAKLSGIAGIARQYHAWAAIDGTLLGAIGTTSKLYIVRAGKLLDITPERSNGAFGNNPLSTTSGQSTVVVTLSAHGAAPGDTVYIRGATAVGGLQIGGGSGAMGASPFTTSNGSNRVVVNHTAHGLADNDRAYFTSVTTVGGIPSTDFQDAAGLRVQVINANSYYVWVETPASASVAGGGSPNFSYGKPYVVTKVNSSAEFVIDAGAAASSSATGGGSGVRYAFDITIGRVNSGASAAGYGHGPYGSGLYGVATSSTDAPARARLWALDHAGEDLIANVSGGAIYHWSPWNLSARAAVLENSPAQCLWALVTSAREIMALGCTTTDGDFDPLCMRHTAPQAITTWTPSPINTAGEERAQAGSRFVSGMLTSQGIVLWTDSAAYIAVDVGAYDQIYRLDLIVASSGLAGPSAAVDCGGKVYWLDPSLQAYQFNGGTPEPMLFPMREWMDAKISRSQVEKIHAHADPKYPAPCWLLPIDGTECNTVMRFDFREAAGDPLAGWSTSAVDRTVWYSDKVLPYPVAVSADGVLYEHEFGFSADGDPIPWHIEWAPLEADNGDFLLYVSRFVLDARREEPINVTLTGRNWPSSEEEFGSGPLAIFPATPHSDLQINARQVGVRISGEMTKRWRLGNSRWELSEAQRRGG